MEFLSGTGARTAQDTDQYGRRRSRRREWLCRASHPHDQGGRSRLERVPGPDLREAAHRTIYRRRVLHEADSFVAWLSDAGRVRGRSGLSDRCDLHFQTTISCPVLRDHYRGLRRTGRIERQPDLQIIDQHAGRLFAGLPIDRDDSLPRLAASLDLYGEERRAFESPGEPVDLGL